MNTQAISILFLKDLYLSRRPLFGYFAAGIACTAIGVVPQPTFAFIGFVLILTVAIGSGMHLLGELLLSEGNDQTRAFILSLPVSLLDYSVAKIAVVLTTFLIPWSTMFACSIVLTAALPWGHVGAIPMLVVVFLELLAAYTVQLVTAVISESVGWTVCVMVACNVFLNLFLMKLFQAPEIQEMSKSDVLRFSPLTIEIMCIELGLIVAALAMAVAVQTRKRDLV
jgi:ABC-2 type transport system permease protein